MTEQLCQMIYGMFHRYIYKSWFIIIHVFFSGSLVTSLQQQHNTCSACAFGYCVHIFFFLFITIASERINTKIDFGMFERAI